MPALTLAVLHASAWVGWEPAQMQAACKDHRR